MADVAEVQLMKISAFTVGSNVYKGIRTLRLRDAGDFAGPRLAESQ